MNNYRKRILIITLFFSIIQIIIIIMLIKDGRSKYDGIVAATLLFIIYSLLELRYNLYLSNYIRSILIITILGHSIVGRYLNFYNTTSFFDILLHIFGTYSFSLFAYSLIDQIFIDDLKSKYYKFIFIISLGISLGTTFEIIEFSFDLIIDSNTKHQYSLIDTNTDLIANIIGSIIAAFHLNWD